MWTKTSTGIESKWSGKKKQNKQQNQENICVTCVLGDRPKSSTSPAKGNSLQGGGGEEAHSYFLDRPGDVDFKNGLKWKLNIFTLFHDYKEGEKFEFGEWQATI